MVITSALVMFALGAPDTLFDNGGPNGANGYSNAVEEVFGSRRTLLDDFELGSYTPLGGLRYHAVWNSDPPGSGTGMEIAIRTDEAGAPGPIVRYLNVTSYHEEATGNTFFSRPEYIGFADFACVLLDGGRYWFEATVIGPENNFWLTAHHRPQECWVNYDDLGGLQPGSKIFDDPMNLAWSLVASAEDNGKCCLPGGICKGFLDPCLCLRDGGVWLSFGSCDDCPTCRHDLDGSDAVDFADVLAVLAAWGPCPGCPEDFDNSSIVDFADLLLVLGAWGPCPEE